MKDAVAAALASGYAVVKDRCVGCNRVVYGYMPLNTPLPEPLCQDCKKNPPKTTTPEPSPSLVGRSWDERACQGSFKPGEPVAGEHAVVCVTCGQKCAPRPNGMPYRHGKFATVTEERTAS